MRKLARRNVQLPTLAHRPTGPLEHPQRRPFQTLQHGAGNPIHAPGRYLGWQIRTSGDVDVVAKAKDMHPKLAAGMWVFFALGALVRSLWPVLGLLFFGAPWCFLARLG